MDHARTGGTLLNQKFTPKIVEGEEGLDNLAHLVRAYFKLDGHHIQFNVVTAETLREAQAHPETPSRSDRACSRLQRLLLRPDHRPARRDHRPHGADRVLAGPGRKAGTGANFAALIRYSASAIAGSSAPLI